MQYGHQRLSSPHLFFLLIWFVNQRFDAMLESSSRSASKYKSAKQNLDLQQSLIGRFEWILSNIQMRIE